MDGVVVKIGTSSLTNADGVIDASVIAKVADEVATLRSGGTPVTIVTSGAIAAGMPVMGIAACLLYTSPSPRDATLSRMPSSA